MLQLIVRNFYIQFYVFAKFLQVVMYLAIYICIFTLSIALILGDNQLGVD